LKSLQSEEESSSIAGAESIESNEKSVDYHQKIVRKSITRKPFTEQIECSWVDMTHPAGKDQIPSS
jgi:hypothetical protein